MSVRLCIFTRVPRLGRVKSRLADTLGAEVALYAHCLLAEDTLARLAPMPGVAAELWLDGPPNTVIEAWQARWELPVRQQSGTDLGARMYGALLDCLAAETAGIVVGTDCPSIDAHYVARATRALDSHDLVLGPAVDGGFGLVGLSRPVAGLFEGVAWGGARALADTLANATRERLRICLLPEIWDVDTAADWGRWLRERGDR